MSRESGRLEWPIGVCSLPIFAAVPRLIARDILLDLDNWFSMTSINKSRRVILSH